MATGLRQSKSVVLARLQVHSLYVIMANKIGHVSESELKAVLTRRRRGRYRAPDEAFLPAEVRRVIGAEGVVESLHTANHYHSPRPTQRAEEYNERGL